MLRQKNMVMFDANMILRYLLNDNAGMAEQAERYLNQNQVTVTTEVIAEVIYVLSGVYHMKRDKISRTLLGFLEMVHCRDSRIVKIALETYGEQNLDFVDCVLYAYHRVESIEIATFDRCLW